MTERTERKEKVMQLEEEKIRKHVKKLLEKCGSTKGDVAITEGSKLGDNYTSTIYRITVKGRGTEQQTELSFIAKRPPIDQTRREIVHFDRMFSRELYFYSQVIPIFTDLLAEYNRSLDLFPKLCAQGMEYGDEILIMEDLARSGYRMHTSKMLDYQHLAIALRFLGQFHAYSFVLRVKKPEIFEKLKRIEEPLFRQRKPDDPSRWLRATPLYNIIAQVSGRFVVDREIPIYEETPLEVHVDETVKYNVIGKQVEKFNQLQSLLIAPAYFSATHCHVTQALADQDVRYQERFARFTEKIPESMIDAVQGSTAEPYAVVNHGDAWTNNILFKYSPSRSGEEEPVDLRFVDFQLHRYASPALDILYLLFCCSTYSTRKALYETLLEVYYDSLSKCLDSFGCDSSVLFPRRELTRHLKQFGKFVAGMAIYVVHVFTEDATEGGEIETQLDAKKLERRLHADPFYKRTIVETYRDLIDRDYI